MCVGYRVVGKDVYEPSQSRPVYELKMDILEAYLQLNVIMELHYRVEPLYNGHHWDQRF